MKIRQMNNNVYTNEGNSAKRFNARIYYLRKDKIKNYNVIINAKTLMTKSLISI